MNLTSQHPSQRDAKMPITSPFLRFEDVKSRAFKFCQDRDWFIFHQPRNLLIALAGECGELGEIFQWRGPLQDGLDNSFTARDKEHIGEELSDVLIYSTRLCDVCSIDLSGAIRFCLQHNSASFKVAEEKSVEFRCSSWSPLDFSEVETELISSHAAGGAFFSFSKSPRDSILKINTYLGELCSTFLGRTEDETLAGLSAWSRPEATRAALCLACICILSVWTAHISGLQLSKCASDKMNKNEAKYPVTLAKGSSAKYTEYVDKLKTGPITLSSLGIVGSVATVIIGVVFAVFRRGRM